MAATPEPTPVHPNVALLSSAPPGEITTDLYAPNAVWHYYNSEEPELNGDYKGIDGIKEFFRKVGEYSQGTFKVEPLSAEAWGDELVVVHTRNSMDLPDRKISFDVAVVWRFVDGKVVEVWDVPSLYSGFVTEMKEKEAEV